MKAETTANTLFYSFCVYSVLWLYLNCYILTAYHTYVLKNLSQNQGNGSKNF
jgi:hypothetical protein